MTNSLDQVFSQFSNSLSNNTSNVDKITTRAATPVVNFVKKATGLFASNKTINVPSLNYKVSDLQQKQSPIVKNFIKSAQQGIQDWAIKNPVKANKILNFPSQAVQAVTEPIASIPYNLARNKIKAQSKNLITIPGKYYPERPPILQTRISDQRFSTPAPNMSYIPEDQILIKDENNPQLEAIKQKILAGENVRLSARQYLSDIPIRYAPVNMGDQNWGGVAVDANTPFREIVINPDIAQPQKIETAPGVFRSETEQETAQRVDYQLNETIRHELLHQTPQLLPTKLFTPENKQVINDYVQRWGKEYFKNPKNKKFDTQRLVGEMFAEEALPPAYYWHVFKRVVPDAKPKDFIDQIKSYFVNNINNPQPTPQPTNSVIPSNIENIMSPISVPGTGGGPILNQ